MIRPRSFAFSGCGWLSPFYLGVIEVAKKEMFLTKDSLVAGTSGGSLGAVLALSDLDMEESLEAIIKFSMDHNFKKNIDVGLRSTLDDLLPSDIVDKCNGRLHVTTTRIWPNIDRKPHIVSHFKDRQHLLDTVSASCFIPLYSSPYKLFTRIQQNPNELFIDGGVYSFMPPIGDIRVSVFPKEFLSLVWKRHPHICLPYHSFPISTLLGYVLNPAPPNQLRKLYENGKREAQIFISESKV